MRSDSPWSFVLGSALGFALGVLLAPATGQKTRRRVAYQLEHAALHLRSVLDGLAAPGVNSDARRTGDALVQDARVKAQRIRDDIDALLHELRH
ncbi:MAG: YtxH domain-containing protein [Bacteroidota bacterium]